ncbi:interleukin-1 receptor accessory protein isoform X3 [Hemiscyllium ocellatum]|uniref:interleukin-1 receptor accessory protein isoform X3 n=1 Tax=Hemiscyllium ocellatum TaxID=170820 RepID=UPI002966E697|nr:interleukin-1 receptor accessory protein isoform X3 [Hemiscyllium ocellatum]
MPWSHSIFALYVLTCIDPTQTYWLNASGQCMDWDVSNVPEVRAYDGEPARVSCPLFSTHVKLNYSTARGSGLTLTWYKNRQTEELIDFDQAGNRITKEQEVLWFWPVFANDSGNYTCMFRNTTYCLKVTVPLLVIQKGRNDCNSSKEMIFPVQFALGETKYLSCPDTTEFSKSSTNSTVAWYTYKAPSEHYEEDQCQGCCRVEEVVEIVSEIEGKLVFHVVREYHRAEYTCVVTMKQREQPYTLTRTVSISICASQQELKAPVLVLPKVNQQVIVEHAPSYATELGCAFGVTLSILVTSIIVYHFWWIEIVLLYRLYFGADETVGDGKEFDVYMSYARNSKEEEFVLTTLQSVLENEYGYKICIYDRDSLPGGIITDETLACIWKSRRLLVVLSPNYLVNGTQALLELKAGTERMASTGQIRVILVEFSPVKKVHHVPELRRLKAVTATIKWEGEKSQDPRSRFWKQLRVALPTKSKTQRSERESRRLVYDNCDSLLQDGKLPRYSVSEN